MWSLAFELEIMRNKKTFINYFTCELLDEMLDSWMYFFKIMILNSENQIPSTFNQDYLLFQNIYQDTDNG